LIAYIPALEADFIWDDDAYVSNNTTLRSGDGLRRIWFELGATPQYYPLVFTTFWAEYQIWETEPTGYHLINVLLHALSAVLLWRVLRALGVPGAWIAAAVFALHPVQVESVAWITERKNVLSGVFYLAAALAYLRYDARREAASARSGRTYALSLALFLCALLSKTVTATLPAALLLTIWWQRGRVTWRDVKPQLPFFVFGTTFGLVTAWIERTHVGASGTAWDLTPVDRVLIAGRAVWFYATKLAWPNPLIFIYPYWRIDASVWWQFLFPATAVALVVTLWISRSRLGRGPLVAVLFFGGTLVPALGFFNVYPMRYSFVADHFQYLASIGLIALAVAAGVTAIGRLEGDRKRITAIGATVILLLLGTLTWRQAHSYDDLESLWRSTLEKNPQAWMAHVNLGTLLFGQGKRDEAFAQYVAGLAAHPLQDDARIVAGAELAQAGQGGDALPSLLQAVTEHAFCEEALDGIGVVLASAGHLPEGLTFFTASVTAAPDYPSGHFNRGRALLQLRREEEAVEAFRATLKHDPNFIEAYRQLALALTLTGEYDEARDRLRTYQSLGGTPPADLVRELGL
jgi:tetratricopeptide (TPR) repeat protein